VAPCASRASESRKRRAVPSYLSTAEAKDRTFSRAHQVERERFRAGRTPAARSEQQPRIGCLDEPPGSDFSESRGSAGHHDGVHIENGLGASGFVRSGFWPRKGRQCDWIWRLPRWISASKSSGSTASLRPRSSPLMLLCTGTIGSYSLSTRGKKQNWQSGYLQHDRKEHQNKNGFVIQ
jgi:hypothetical protein